MTWTIEKAIARAKREILQDANAGVIPRTVASFSELHDYVDANEYGGMCEDSWPTDADGNPDIVAGNELQYAVDAWIKAGGVQCPCRHAPRPCKACRTK